MSDKGLQPYSPAWVEKYASHIPEPHRSCVVEICRSYYMGNSYDPDILWKILRKSFPDKETNNG